MARAKAKGVHVGRPRKPVGLRPVRAMLAQGHSLRETARALGVSVRTIKRRLDDTSAT